MVFFLEINGHLKKCRVEEPFSGQMARWNAMRNMERPGTDGFEFAKDSLRQVARECVEAGAYQEVE